MWCKLFEIRRLIFHVGDPIYTDQARHVIVNNMLSQHIRESLQVTPGPFPDFWKGLWHEAIQNMPEYHQFKI